MKIRFAVAPGAGLPDAAALIAFAGALEANGFDGAWLSDVPLAPTLDPMLGLALIAGRTSNLRLGANIVPLGRNPFLLAKALAQLDQLSGGRVLLSFVSGLGHPGEREALGLDGAKRGDVLETVLARVRELWEQEPVTRPVQEPLEVWLGGRGPQALDRVGRLADGWLGAALTPPEASVAREQIQVAAERAGREVDPEHFGLSIPYARVAPEPAELAAMRGSPATLAVGADGLHALLDGYLDAGLSKFVFRPMAPVSDWDEEAAWLAGAILELQTT
jgi:probable F420-dependent oxidoreductase